MNTRRMALIYAPDDEWYWHCKIQIVLSNGVVWRWTPPIVLDDILQVLTSYAIESVYIQSDYWRDNYEDHH